MNRRDFLSAGALGCGAGLSLTGCIGFHYVNSSLEGSRLVIRQGDLGSSRFVLVDAPGLPLPLYIHRGEDGTYSAVSTRCMHRGCQVEPAAGHLVCPCHGSEYTNAGEVLKGPTQRPLQRYPVSVEGERIVVSLVGQ